MKKIALLLLLMMGLPIWAQPPVIVKAEAMLKSNQLFDIAVTLRHPDTGWDHYASEWVIIADDEIEIAKRTLYHPHVNEQPFTRYVRDINIPTDLKSLKIYAQCNKGHKSNAFNLLTKQ